MNYIDTSAFVKYYGNPDSEKGVDKIYEIIQKAKLNHLKLITSIFMIGETISVFDRWVRLKIITQAESQKLINNFLLDVSSLIELGSMVLRKIDAFTILFSTEFITKHHVSINDAIHLHTALTTLPKVKTFICSDKLLNAAAEKEGLKVFNPED